MIKQTIVYIDYNGEEKTEDHYFSLSAADVARMEISTKGGMYDHLKAIAASKNGATIVSAFEEFVEKSYGIRSEDGTRFSKKPEHFEAFKETGAYDEFFITLVTDAAVGEAFVKGIMPADLANKMSKQGTLALGTIRPEDHLSSAKPVVTE